MRTFELNFLFLCQIFSKFILLLPTEAAGRGIPQDHKHLVKGFEIFDILYCCSLAVQCCNVRRKFGLYFQI